MYDYQHIIDKYYPAGTSLRDIYMRHCRSVASLALKIAHEHNLPIDDGDIEAGAMLHDIGIFLTDAPGIHCYGTKPYIAHGYLGADLLRQEGAPETFAKIAERHTGAGLTPGDISLLSGKLPADRTYLPETTLEKLICYADKFYSKSGDMQMKARPRVMASLAKFGAEAPLRFQTIEKELGITSE